MVTLDLIVIATLLLAGLIGLLVGSIRIALWFGAWMGAGLVTVYGFPHARPLARKWIDSGFLADLAAVGMTFLVTLVILMVVSQLISNAVRGGAIGMADRSVGLILGLALGLAAASGALLAAGGLLNIPDDRSRQPDWIRKSRTAPILAWFGGYLVATVPDDWHRAAAQTPITPPSPAELGEAAKRLMTPIPDAVKPKEKSGYNDAERREMNRIFNSQR